MGESNKPDAKIEKLKWSIREILSKGGGVYFFDKAGSQKLHSLQSYQVVKDDSLEDIVDEASEYALQIEKDKHAFVIKMIGKDLYIVIDTKKRLD